MRRLHTVMVWLLVIASIQLTSAQPDLDSAQSQSFENDAFQRAEQYFMQSNWPEAAIPLRQVLDKTPDNIAALYRLALVYYKMEDFLEAELNLEKLFTIEPSYAQAYGLYGLTLYNRQAYQQAIIAIDMASALGISDEIKLARGVSYIAIGEPQKSLNDFDDILAEDPGNTKACLGKSAALMELGKYAYAIQYLNRVLSYNDENVDALTNRAICQFYLNNKEAANEDFLLATYLSPNVRTYLSMAKCHIANNNLTAAFSAVKTAMRLGPNSPEVYLVLGEVELEMGKFTEAIQSFDIALEIDHTCTDCYLLKSEAKAHAALYHDAISDLYALIEIEPRNQKAKEMLLWVYGEMDRNR